MKQLNPNNIHALTRDYKGISNFISTPVKIANFSTRDYRNTLAIWDTGASNSVTTKSLVKKLELVAISLTRTRGVHGDKIDVPVYAIKLHMNNFNTILRVTECEELLDDGSHGILIGMDVITKGDFTITNFNGNTVMTFRIPSIETLDFVKALKA